MDARTSAFRRRHSNVAFWDNGGIENMARQRRWSDLHRLGECD